MIRKIFIIILVLVGAALLSYPWFSNWYAGLESQKVIEDYQDKAAALNEESIDEEIARAEAYNKSLSGVYVDDPFVPGSGTAIPRGYDELLNPDGSGVMAVLRIPKIDLRLPVSHSVSDEVLKHGIGHMPTTALPVGGPGTHCILAGHRGLPRQELFTRLDVLEPGDEFYLDVPGMTSAYRIDDIRIVHPEDTDLLKPVTGEDYVTLATCTPLGVNSHRLLVRGKRIPYVQIHEQQVPKRTGLSASELQLLIGASAALIVMTAMIVMAAKRRNRRNLQLRSHPSSEAD
ncbi:MAG: class C sortase [Clostridiales Family XIII bacterium]|jgi:sortase A|nr:class C sortase [Clostridiales Family XIII bacterium]